jgi:cytochrome c biogenesis protein CcmG, thiol:disulfide interchange protein DsbE
VNRFLLPLGLFIVLLGFLAVGLNRDPREVPSPFIGKPAPAFEIPQLADPTKTFSPKDMLGKVWLLNVWASWCPSCRDEHALIVQAVRNGGFPPVVGLNWKDQRADALRWLGQFGDPYSVIAYDPDNHIGIDYGVYGAPETYLIDKAGVIRYKHIGAITPEVMETKLLKKIKELEQ